MKKRIVLDFETRSRCDLKKAGAFKYSLDPSTQPTCLAIKSSREDEVRFFDFSKINNHWTLQSVFFQTFWKCLIDSGYRFTAHNAFFERCIYTNILVNRYGWPEIPVKQWRCTAAKASACALPRSLAGAGEALKLTIQKDFRGYQAMMKTCKALKGTDRFLEPEDDPDVWNTLYEYCKIDVLTEEKLDDALPDLIPQEQEIWHLNQELNWRGLRVDIPLVEKIVGIMEIESKKKLRELDSLTMGLVTKAGARKSIFDFLELEGVKLPNLQKKTVDDKLEGFDLSKDMRRLLELRKALSLTSTKKYQSFLSRSWGGRIRDILLYHGASTGRDTGTGVQPHNFPRGLISVDERRPYAATENIAECDYEMLQVLYGDTLPIVFSSILRNMIIPTRDYELFVADFSKIEVAVCWWLAGNTPGLKVLRDGGDPYIHQAMANTGKKASEITFEDRQLAKAQVLGAQFGMGANKFRETARVMYGLELSEVQSKAAIDNYRRVNAAVPVLWKHYENGAIAATEYDAESVINYCRFFLEDKFLWVKLPSGRCLAYREPQISWRETDYGPRKTLEFWAVNSKTKKWAIERTWGGTLTENIVQAVARDLMMFAIVNLEKAGYRALLTVHDEAICERKIGEGNLKEFMSIMTRLPDWAKGLPLEAKSWQGPRYRK